MPRTTTAGRPQRALAFLGLALALGFSARLPLLMADAGATLAALRPPRLPGNPPAALLAATVAPVPPPLLARFAAPELPLVRLRPVPAAPPVMLADADPPPSVPALPLPTAPAQSPPVPYAPPGGFEMATQAYARLAAGDRRGAARLFDAAIAAGPDPRAVQWQSDRAALSRRWSGEVYALARDGGNAGPAASPVLGGGQSGANLAWTIDPLARRPLALVARSNAANNDPQSSQAAIGLRWRPLPGVSISAERLIAIGATARNDWTLRLAAGADGRQGPIRWTGYGEAGVLGNGDIYAGGQARALLPLARIGRIRLAGGPGGWASIQTGGATAARVDIGPSLVTSTPLGRFSVDLAADWRFRVAGDAEPGSGPAVTISTHF
jgi:hypothetical protein